MIRDFREEIIIRLLDLYEAPYADGDTINRDVGVEDEHLLRRSDGSIGSTADLFSAWSDDWKRTTTSDGLTDLRHGDLGLLTTDAGIGTTEWNTPAYMTLWELHEASKRFAQFMTEACLLSNQVAMEYGIQPVTLPCRELWQPKARYDLIIRRFAPQVHMGTITASRQVHIKVTRTELPRALRVMKALTFARIMVAANSPVHASKLDPFGRMATRAEMWDDFSDARRTGIGYGSIMTNKDLIEHMLGSELFVYREDGKYHFYDQTMWRFIRQRGRSISDELLHSLLVSQLGTHWFDVRSTPFGTIECRESCQGPDSIGIAALALGMVQSWRDLEPMVNSKPWLFWKRARKAANRDGMEAEVNGVRLKDLCHEIIMKAVQGLSARGLKEVELLDAPLHRLANPARVPATRAQRVFEDDGIEGLLEHTSLKVA